MQKRVLAMRTRSTYMGVSFHKVRNEWHAQYKGKSLGYAATPVAAAQLVSKASKESVGDQLVLARTDLQRHVRASHTGYAWYSMRTFLCGRRAVWILALPLQVC